MSSRKLFHRIQKGKADLIRMQRQALSRIKYESPIFTDMPVMPAFNHPDFLEAIVNASPEAKMAAGAALLPISVVGIIASAAITFGSAGKTEDYSSIWESLNPFSQVEAVIDKEELEKLRKIKCGYGNSLDQEVEDWYTRKKFNLAEKYARLGGTAEEAKAILALKYPKGHCQSGMHIFSSHDLHRIKAAGKGIKEIEEALSRKTPDGNQRYLNLIRNIAVSKVPIQKIFEMEKLCKKYDIGADYLVDYLNVGGSFEEADTILGDTALKNGKSRIGWATLKDFRRSGMSLKYFKEIYGMEREGKKIFSLAGIVQTADGLSRAGVNLGYLKVAARTKCKDGDFLFPRAYKLINGVKTLLRKDVPIGYVRNAAKHIDRCNNIGIAIAKSYSLKIPAEETGFTDTKKPNSVVTYPVSDWNNGFDNWAVAGFLKNLRDHYDVRISFTDNVGEICMALDEVPEILLFIPGGHGTSTTMLLKKQKGGCTSSYMMDPVIRQRAFEIKVPSVAPEPDTKEYIYGEEILKAGDTLLPKHLGNLLPGAVVLLDSCSNAAEAKEGKNMAEYMTGIVPYGVTVIASKTDFSINTVMVDSYVPFSAFIKNPENTYCQTRYKPIEMTAVAHQLGSAYTSTKKAIGVTQQFWEKFLRDELPKILFEKS